MSKKKEWVNPAKKWGAGKKVFTGSYEKVRTGRIFALVNGKLNKEYSSAVAAKKDGWVVK